ncbi:MAG TPA: LytTR family DNA-binding domain-containing protein [Syntrophales bacterium]|nr:LytTR family DNA-binding domain-containing protein [Syntrophales bacterium]
MMLRCAIVDDELPACDELSHLLQEMDGVEVISCAHSGVEALASIKTVAPDVVFLDIKMPGLSGFDVAREILTLSEPPFIVFATAYDEYAVDAFDLKAVDYILKPFSRDRVVKTVERLRELSGKKLDISALKAVVDQLNRKTSRKNFTRVSVVEKGKILLISPEEISHCRAYYGRSEVFTKDRSFFSSATLDELEKRLSNENFFRMHRSYLVNLEYIRDVVPYINGKYLITLHGGCAIDIPVSRRRAQALKEILAL